MVQIRDGSFLMGSEDFYTEEGPAGQTDPQIPQKVIKVARASAHPRAS